MGAGCLHAQEQIENRHAGRHIEHGAANADGGNAFLQINIGQAEQVAGFGVVYACQPLLEQGKHLLVEKPMTDNAGQAADLVRLARQHDCVLQVGHIERFNPVFNYLQQAAREPRFIESHRLSPFPARSMDIGVVLDLMIHDLDIVLAFVRSPVEHVDAAGVRVLSASEDIANARLRFANGCVANLTVSRVSPESLRKIRVFSGGDEPGYVSLDYREQRGYHYRLARDDEQESSTLKKIFGSLF
jgi:predicted dehydrogenase